MRMRRDLTLISARYRSKLEDINRIIRPPPGHAPKPAKQKKPRLNFGPDELFE